MGWTIGVLGFDSRRGLVIFLFSTSSRTVLGPTQSPIQWVPGALSLGVKWPGREADHSPPSSAEVKEWVELCFHSSNTLSWRSVQLKNAQRQFYIYLSLSVCMFRLRSCWTDFCYIWCRRSELKALERLFQSYWSENLKGRDHSRDLDVVRNVILKCIIKKLGFRM
jgi:hypothetical protein